MQLAMRSHTDLTAGVLEETLVTSESNAVSFYATVSGLAKDKIGYPIREICSNAWDASGGNFEVFLPTALSPNFRVRDYGPGISHGDMLGRFARIFASDKRDDNTKLGGWGLGRFSTLAYLIGQNGSAASIVTSHHGGMSRTYVMSLNAEGQPMIRLMGERPSSVDSGLEVSFPVNRSDIQAFADRASYILWSFEPRPRIFPEISWSDPEIIMQGQGWKFFRQGTTPLYGPHVRLGCVAYPIDLDQVDAYEFNINYRDHLLLEVSIGSASPTLSREVLQYDDRTKAAIRKAMENCLIEARQQIGEVVAGASTYFDACRMFYEQTAGLPKSFKSGLGGVEWRGHAITSTVLCSPGKAKMLRAGWLSCGSFHSESVSTADIPSETTIVLQHSSNQPQKRFELAGLVGKNVLLIKCARDVRETILNKIGNPDGVITLEDFKVPTVVNKTTFRKRRVLKVNHYDQKFEIESVDMAAGGYYVHRRGADRYDDYFNMSAEHTIDKYALRKLIASAKDLGILPQGTRVLLKNHNEELKDGWQWLGDVIIPALQAKVDPNSIDPSSRKGRYSIPSKLTDLHSDSDNWPANTPAAFLNLKTAIQSVLDRLSGGHIETDSDKAASALRAAGISVELRKDDTTFSEILQSHRDLMAQYPLYETLRSGCGSWSSNSRMSVVLRHYFELTEIRNVAANCE